MLFDMIDDAFVRRATVRNSKGFALRKHNTVKPIIMLSNGRCHRSKYVQTIQESNTTYNGRPNRYVLCEVLSYQVRSAMPVDFAHRSSMAETSSSLAASIRIRLLVDRGTWNLASQENRNMRKRECCGKHKSAVL